MTNIDQFESVFKAADKQRFVLEPVSLRSILLVSDLGSNAEEAFDNRAQSFLGFLDEADLNWAVLEPAQSESVRNLVDEVNQRSPDLVCTHRNLHMNTTEYPYSLGAHLDVLTQATDVPVLVMPHPELLNRKASIAKNTDNVMAITDHLAGDHHLVSYAAKFTQPNGRLWLSHVEDRATLERFLDTIGRIPEIDTETARHTITERLLKDPTDFVQTCRDVLRETNPHIDVETIVTLGNQLSDYRRLLDEHSIDLLVLNTKDEDQLAMHGVAYPLTVELCETPLLLL